MRRYPSMFYIYIYTYIILIFFVLYEIPDKDWAASLHGEMDPSFHPEKEMAPSALLSFCRFSWALKSEAYIQFIAL